MIDFREDSYRDKLERRYGLEPAKRVRWGDILFSAAFGLVVFFLLAGCEQLTQPVQGICAFQPIGENEEGVQFFRYHCKPSE